MDQGLDQLRQTIHEQTAPKSPAAERRPAKNAAGECNPRGQPVVTAQRKSGKPGRRVRKG